MSTAPVRAGMVPITRRVRAYFAPVDRGTGTPTLFDPGKYGVFLLDAPPPPWLDLGWIDNFQRFCGTGTDLTRAGEQAVPVLQFRGALDARVEFEFREWGKLQMALAAGSEHMNVLASDPSANAQPSGGTPITAVAVLPGSTASEIFFGAGAVDAFSVGDIIAVDVDYQQQTGYVGTTIAAAYVNNAADVNRDLNYLRRITFNLGRVIQKTATSVLLAQPLLGGDPQAGANAQAVVAFVDREGGHSFRNGQHCSWRSKSPEEEFASTILDSAPRLSRTAHPARRPQQQPAAAKFSSVKNQLRSRSQSRRWHCGQHLWRCHTWTRTIHNPQFVTAVTSQLPCRRFIRTNAYALVTAIRTLYSVTR